jgi:16S rRNA (guanine527-N7)-methyltransferase
MTDTAAEIKKIKSSALAVLEPERFEVALAAGAEKFGLELLPEQKARFLLYYQELVEKNRVMNLTGITEAAEVAEKHMIDSLVLLSQQQNFASVIDVGSGAGFPGLPLAIMRPDTKTVLLDSQKKRCLFLSDLVKKLDLPQVSVLWDRAETAAKTPQYRQQFELAVARAVAPLPVLLEYLLPFVRTGGYVCALKGAKAQAEIAAAKNAAKTLGAEFLPLYEYEIAGERHGLVRLRKIKDISAKYPRSAALIKKNPLS